jgi:large subunit ribosomal protein L29
MKVAEIKEMSTADLQEKIQTEKANYTQMLLNHAVSPLENNAQIKAARRNIARMLTILRQRELNNK